MIIALIVEAFKISILLGGAVLGVVVGLNVLSFVTTRLFAIPVLAFVVVASFTHKSYLSLTSQTDKLRRYYGEH
jgi:hypothetical protein